MELQERKQEMLGSIIEQSESSRGKSMSKDDWEALLR